MSRPHDWRLADRIAANARACGLTVEQWQRLSRRARKQLLQQVRRAAT